jgi:hypothetical protein
MRAKPSRESNLDSRVALPRFHFPRVIESVFGDANQKKGLVARWTEKGLIFVRKDRLNSRLTPRTNPFRSVDGFSLAKSLLASFRDPERQPATGNSGFDDN